MAHEIRIPRLGWSMEEGVFVGWLKRPGERVEIGEPLFELESDKALQQIESIDAGTLHVLEEAAKEGETLAVGALLGYLLAVGEPAPSMPGTPAGGATVQAITPEAPARSHDAARAEPLPLASIDPVATPRARRLAAELGVDWKSLKGSGREGRIREVDIAAVGARAFGQGASGQGAGAAFSARRRAIAERLRRSQERTIPVTLTTTADATNLAAWREAFRAAGESIVPAYTDLVELVVARTLARHPRMAVRWEEGREALIPIGAEEIDVAIAVDTPDGLLAPVVRRVESKSALEIARESVELIERARGGRLSTAEMQGGAITISNLGAYGIDAFTPVINYPQIAILGLGAMRMMPVCAADGSIVARRQITLSLTFDHAAVDGAPAAEFLRDVVRELESRHHPA